MPRTHGYAPRGSRCPGTQDWHAKGRVNALGALLAGALLSVGLTTANVDAEIFNLWLGRDLIPKLPAKVVLVMEFEGPENDPVDRFPRRTRHFTSAPTQGR